MGKTQRLISLHCLLQDFYSKCNKKWRNTPFTPKTGNRLFQLIRMYKFTIVVWSSNRSVITTGLKLFRISMLSTEPALSTVAVKPKMAFKTSSNNGKCYYWYCILRWLTWVIPGYPQCVQQIHLWGFMSTQAGLSLLWDYLSFCRVCCAPVHLQLWCKKARKIILILNQMAVLTHPYIL